MSHDFSEAELSDLLQRAIPEPRHSIEAASIRTRMQSSARPTSGWVAPALSAALVLAVAASVFVVHMAGRHHSTQTNQGTNSSTTNTERRRATSDALQRTLASFTVPATWRPSTRSLSKDLVLPTEDPGSYQVNRGLLWVTPIDADTAMDYLTSHLPTQVTLGNSSEFTHDFASVVLTPGPQLAKTDAYGGMGLSAFAERLSPHSSGVYLGASAYWLPVRTLDQTIPTDVTGAAVTLNAQMDRKTYRGRLGTVASRELARAINQLAVTYQAPSTCPVQGATATITFASADGPQIVTVSRFCPAGVFVKPRTSGMELDLEPGNLYRTILKLLGSPPGFGPP